MARRRAGRGLAGVPQRERVFDVHAKVAVINELCEAFEFGAVGFHGDAGEPATGGGGPVGEGGVGALDGGDQKAAGAEHGDGPGAVVAADHFQHPVAGDGPRPRLVLAEKSVTFGGWRTIDRTARPAYAAQVRGATHVSFMDVPFLPLRPDAPISGLLPATSIDAGLMWRIVTELLLAFFGETLQGQWVRGSRGCRRYPVVTVVVPARARREGPHGCVWKGSAQRQVGGARRAEHVGAVDVPAGPGAGRGHRERAGNAEIRNSVGWA